MVSSPILRAAAAGRLGFAVDLDRVMTVEKSIVADWKRTPGWELDQEVREFAMALARKGNL